jgi:tetratricopeptide (TPR) repeat protein
LDAYNQVLKRGKPDASLLLEKANALLELNRVEGTLEYLSISVFVLVSSETESNFHNVPPGLEALPVFDKAIKTSPRDTTGYIGKATALLSLPGRENEVIACYDQAIEIDHFNSSCMSNSNVI